jgi:hypothetical protein
MFNNKLIGPRDELTYVLNGMLKKIIAKIEDSPFHLIFLEQNPNKNSVYGKKAKNGTNIMWVIVYNKETKKERWLGRVEAGVWYGNNY